MKLSMSMIESRLTAYDVESDIQDDSRTIRGMRFISEQQLEYSRDYVFIGQAMDYLEDPRYANAFILASGRNNIVCRGSDYEALLNEVLGSFDFFNEAEQRLLVAASKHAPLQEMMPIVAEMLADPFVVFGIDGTVLASVNPERIASPRMRKNVLVKKNLGADGIGGYFVDEAGVIHHDLSAVPLSMSDDEGAVAVSMYLYRDTEPIGFIMHFPSSRKNDVLAQAIDSVIAVYLAQSEEFTSAHSPHQSQRLALVDLMGGGHASREALERLAVAVGGETGLVVVSVASLVIQNRTQRLLLANEVEESPVACVACELDETVAFLVQAERAEDLVAQIARQFNSKSLALGVSMPVAGFGRVQSAYRQAVFARSSSPHAGIRYCRDLALPFLIGALRKEPVSHDLLHPALGALEGYDAENGTDLLETLRAYVETGYSQSETAHKLYVHLNTLKYRLKRIGELTGVDFKDRDTLFHIELSFRLASAS